jgi:hypothetical protein
MKKFVPFDQFEKSCAPLGKPLAESMAASCDARFAPEPVPTCNEVPCAPFWQPTCEIRCLSNGLVDAEEQDGCGNTRWVRTPDVVEWVDGDLVACVDDQDEGERVYRTQTNQCGDTRQVWTGDYCCTPAWADVEPPVLDCAATLLRYQQEDGCGNERLRTSSDLVTWTDNTERRCSDGYYQREEVNQCGALRWTNISEYVWVDTGETRCIGAIIEAEQANQCGDLRWVNTGTAIEWVDTSTETCDGTHQVLQENQCEATRWSDRGVVVWTNTGETQCGPISDNIENEQTNQCGDLRWFDTGVACTSPLPAMPATAGGGCYVKTAAEGSSSWTLKFNSNGTGTRTTSIGDGTAPFTWAPGTVDGSNYEIMVEYDFAGSGASYTGPAEGVWTSLAAMVQMQWTVTGPTPNAAVLTGNVHIRLVGNTDPDDTMEIIDTFLSIDVECP